MPQEHVAIPIIPAAREFLNPPAVIPASRDTFKPAQDETLRAQADAIAKRERDQSAEQARFGSAKTRPII